MNNDAQESARLAARLDAVLRRLPDAPVPSNFTARVLDAVDREDKIAARPAFGWNWRAWFPRFAVAAAVLLFVGIVWQRQLADAERTMLVRQVAMVAVHQPAPGLEALQNLEAIQGMSQSARADGELLAALQ